MVEKSDVGGGNTRYTEDKGSYVEDRTVDQYGNIISIDHHDKGTGDSHSHNAVHDILGGVSPGSRK